MTIRGFQTLRRAILGDLAASKPRCGLTAKPSREVFAHNTSRLAPAIVKRPRRRARSILRRADQLPHNNHNGSAKVGATPQLN
jgi:hypothetical protein